MLEQLDSYVSIALDFNIQIILFITILFFIWIVIDLLCIFSDTRCPKCNQQHEPIKQVYPTVCDIRKNNQRLALNLLTEATAAMKQSFTNDDSEDILDIHPKIIEMNQSIIELKNKSRRRMNIIRSQRLQLGRFKVERRRLQKKIKQLQEGLKDTIYVLDE